MDTLYRVYTETQLHFFANKTLRKPDVSPCTTLRNVMVRASRPCAYGDQRVAPHGEDILFDADEIDDDGGEDESGEEHDGLEAAVPEERARHAEHEVEPAYRRCGRLERYKSRKTSSVTISHLLYTRNRL